MSRHQASRPVPAKRIFADQRYHEISLSAVDAEFLESRKFRVVGVMTELAGESAGRLLDAAHDLETAQAEPVAAAVGSGS